MIEEPKQENEGGGGFKEKIITHKKIIMTVIIVMLAVVCFSLSIFAMSSAVVYFSYMFSVTTELIAKSYLKQHYSWYLATTYLAIFGLVIVLSNTTVHFTSFNQKQRILWIHLIFYLGFFICGIVALAGSSDYLANMTNLATTTTCPVATNFQCYIAIPFLLYRANVTSYFIGYCICFFAYAALYHYSSYTEKRQKQEQTISKVQMNQSETFQQKPKTLQSVSDAD